MAKTREETADSDTWDLKPLYKNQESWEEAFECVKKKFWDEIREFKGTLSEGTQNVKKLFYLTYGLEQELMSLYTYAHLRHDEDVAHENHKNAYNRISALLYRFAEETSWIEPELLGLPAQTLQSYVDSHDLTDYKMTLDKTARLKPHTLTAREEELVALAGKSLEVSEKAFGALNNADIKFPQVKDGKGKDCELSHGLYQVYLRSPDRVLRENAFKALHNTFLGYENTLCELLAGNVQKHVFNAKIRNYDSALQAALFPHKIDTAVYDNLISSTHASLNELHRFVSLRKKLMNLPDIHLYDLYAPAASDVDMQFSYDEAVHITLEAMEPLGTEYVETLRRGLVEERWVDRYENLRKRSGAYSSGCYNSYPYILLNYQGHLNDVMTLAHEAGHSMHSYYSNQKQPYHNADYSIFVAEVASTFNEELVFRHLLVNTNDPKKRVFLLLQKLDGIRATFFRQTMFAEFEKQIHEMAEKEIPLTPATLKEAYYTLNKTYFGPDLIVDEEIKGEFMRVPHFYYNFYVYQYATGISAAFALVEKVLENGPDCHLQFLSAGGSDYPVNVLKNAGVDMCSAQPVNTLLSRFSSLMDQLEAEI